MSILARTTTDHRLGFADQLEEVRVDALAVSGALPGLAARQPRARHAGPDGLRRPLGRALVRRPGDAQPLRLRRRHGVLRQRVPDTDARRQALATGGASISGFATDPCRSLFQRVQSIFSPELTDNANVNLTRLGDEYLAMTETPIPVASTPRRCRPSATTTAPARFGQLTTAHPHHGVGGDGLELLNFAAQLGPPQRVPRLRADQHDRGTDPRPPARARARLHALVRDHAAPRRAAGEPAGGQPAGAGALRPGVHPQLPLEARARPARARLRPRDRRGGRLLDAARPLHLPHDQRVRGRRRPRGRRVRLRGRVGHRRARPRRPARRHGGHPARPAPAPDAARRRPGARRRARRLRPRAAAHRLPPSQRAALPLRLRREHRRARRSSSASSRST